jgi:SAM-dependent methyltransferase
MSMTIHARAVVWTTLCLVAGGCQTRPPAQPAVRPAARLLSVQVEDVQADYITLAFEVEIQNPAPAKLTVTGLRYGLSSGPNLFLSGTPVSGVTIAREAEQVVTLQDTVVCERFLRALDTRLNSTVPFLLELRVFLKARGGQGTQIPVRGGGELFLPPLPPGVAGEGMESPLDVVYIATPQDVVETMLRMARVKETDLVYDLGCGDGRILVTAAREYGCRAAGYELDPFWVRQSRENARKAGVEHLVTVEQKDLFSVDLEPADVIAIYLNPVVNRRLIPQLPRLRPGSRIVSHSFPIGDIPADEVVTMISREDGQEHSIYLWTAPLQGD